MTTGSCRSLCSAIALVIVALTTSSSNARLAASPGQQGPGGGPGEERGAADIAPEALAQIEALIREKDVRSGTQQKIDSQLIYALRMEFGQSIAPGVDAQETDLPYDADGHVVVDVTARDTSALFASLAALGVEVLSTNPDGGMLRVHVNLDQVEALAALPDVTFVQPKQDAQIHQAASVFFTQTGQGTRSSEGDTTHLASAARAAFGATGSGIKIGVLSDGVASLAASQASGDLGPVTVLAGQAGSGDEGTAMLEIIHDLAPDAQLFFATAFKGITSFADNIRALRAAGCDIIVDDVAYFVETPFHDGQPAGVVSNTLGGAVIQAVNDVTAAGALYFSSAGNSGHLSAGTAGTWEGDFVDGGATTSISGQTSGRVHRFGTQNFNVITKAAGGTSPTTLHWSDPLGGSANDYDLFRLNSTGTTVVASSTNIQSGTQDPFEQLGSPGNAGERIVIVKKTTAASRFLHLGTNRGILSIATVGETHGHAAAAAAFDVAATPAVGPFPQPFNASSVVETFSSDGPRRVFYQANGTPYTPGNVSATGGVLRQKPDLTAADGVSVTGAGGFPTTFFGTSAAAPHAAAIAGLLKSANPALTPAQIRTLLTTSAIDIGVAGVDPDSGAGIVMADALLRAAGVSGTAVVEMISVQAAENPGNGNGALEAGEGVRLIIPLANYGGAPAAAVSATLTSSTPGIAITQPATRLYPDLAVSASASAPPYFFTAASDLPCPSAASFTLLVSFAGGPSPRAFSFQVPIGPPAYSITTTLDTAAPPGSTGVTTATGLQTPRLLRDGVASSCAAPKAAPALFGTGTRRFDAYAFNTCATSAPSCVTVTVEGANAINLFSAAYSPTFVSNALQQNYRGDVGASGSSRTYAFNLAGGSQTFVVDVHEVDPGGGLGTPYTLTVAGACTGGCTPNRVPVALAKDVTVFANASGTAAVSIDNGSSDADGDPLTLTQSPAGPYPIGRTTVLLTVSDPKGATSQATAFVTVLGPTTTIVSTSPNPSFVAQPVTVTATVTTSAGGFPTDGSVTFQEGTTILAGPTSLSGGQASFTTSSLSAGAHTITAFYTSASGSFAASNGSIVQQVVNTPTVSTVTLNPGSVTGGVSSTATVTLSSAAPAGNAVVTLASSNPVLAVVPNSVTVAAGQVSATFTVNTAQVTSTSTVVISATFANVTQSATLTLNPAAPPAPTLSAVALNPVSVIGGSASTGTVTLSAVAPSGGVAVSLSENSGATTVPASVTVPAGATSATFTVTTTAVATAMSATISAVLGGVTRTAVLTVNPSPGGQTATLTVIATSRNGERVTSTPAGINVAVGSTGSGSFTTGTSITLSSTNNRDVIWSGACSSGGNKQKTCTFTLNATASVTANVQ